MEKADFLTPELRGRSGAEVYTECPHYLAVNRLSSKILII
jgi:hypothetical protein